MRPGAARRSAAHNRAVGSPALHEHRPAYAVRMLRNVRFLVSRRWPLAVLALSLLLALLTTRAVPAAQGRPAARQVPTFAVDPFWPRPLPNRWIIGAVAGVAVDARDHVWIVQRPSTLHTIDASKTVERIIGSFPAADQQVVRTRLGGAFRYFIAQRLIPRMEGGRVAVLEILKSTMRTREYIEQGEKEGKTLLDAIKDGGLDGMQSFDGEIERLVREHVLSVPTAMLYATNPGNLAVQLADFDPDSIESMIER